MSKTPLKDFTDAAKLDILNILSADEPGVFEFRRARDIAHQLVDFINSYGEPVEHDAVVQAINMAETKAPYFLNVLMGRAFDGNALLHKKYEEMLDEHTQLRHAALNIADAQARISRDLAETETKKDELLTIRAQLEIERERLQLHADTTGQRVNLPTLPKLTRPEPEDPDKGEAVDLNAVAKSDGNGGDL